MVPQCYFLDLHEHLLHIEDVTIYELLGTGLRVLDPAEFVRRVLNFRGVLQAGLLLRPGREGSEILPGGAVHGHGRVFLRGLIINPPISICSSKRRRSSSTISTMGSYSRILVSSRRTILIS